MITELATGPCEGRRSCPGAFISSQKNRKKNKECTGSFAQLMKRWSCRSDSRRVVIDLV